MQRCQALVLTMAEAVNSLLPILAVGHCDDKQTHSLPVAGESI